MRQSYRTSVRTLDHPRTLVSRAADESQLRRLENAQSRHFSLVIPDVAGFRSTIFHEQGRLCLVVRTIPFQIKSFADLRLPAVLQDIAEEQRGPVLVTGATGSGKSTTLAAMIDHLTRTRRLRIVTMFAADERELLQTELATNLAAVVSQRLARHKHKDQGRIPVLEIMRNNAVVGTAIREGRISSLSQAIANREHGMQLFDQHLADL